MKNFTKWDMSSWKMYMHFSKQFAQFLFLITLFIGGFNVQGQSLTKVDSLNGYKTYQLGSKLSIEATDLSTLTGACFEIESAWKVLPQKYFKSAFIDGKGNKINGLEVKSIFVTTYKDVIVRVVVFVEYGELFPMLSSILGPTTSCDNFVDSDPILRRSEACTWKAKNVRLKHWSFTPMKGFEHRLALPWMKSGFQALTYTSEETLKSMQQSLQQQWTESKKDL